MLLLMLLSMGGVIADAVVNSGVIADAVVNGGVFANAVVENGSCCCCDALADCLLLIDMFTPIMVMVMYYSYQDIETRLI